MTMTLAPATAPTVPASTTQITELAQDLIGFHPALDTAVQALADLAAADLTTERSGAIVAALGGLADGHLATLVGLVLRHIANPDTNPALAHLPADRQQDLRRLGAEYSAEIANHYLEQRAAEACAVIEN
ncbi:hypothetical protein HZZ00_37390 (plasmid) [Streptomyces sp. NEAU-sy36]|uniref:hypothetical protein n=1 Tax=unclassified Streptomyces TaxID=2593676 RepID=UPI0015D5F9D1|nr:MULTISPECIES: hypothetical protein [unclassified Streptomyces]QLJ06708.1 hypothetical protein HZZ00_37390 [Streptomyces sp. NEAU-sy36]